MFPRKRQLTTSQIVKILRLLETNDTDVVARKFGVCKRTIERHRDKYHRTNKIGRKPSKRRRKLTNEQLERLENYDKPTATLARIKHDNDFVVADSTLSEYCKHVLKLPTRRSYKKSFIDQDNHENRVTFACMRDEWSVDIWKKYVFLRRICYGQFWCAK